MNPEAQRIAIAEACGWRDVRLVIYRSPFGGSDTEKIQGFRLKKDYRETIPDYLNDLNAMAKARETLTLNQQRDYHDHLQKFCYYPEFCTAAQHAEAFLRTIGKWEGGES